jgi:hypothetical protein
MTYEIHRICQKKKKTNDLNFQYLITWTMTSVQNWLESIELNVNIYIGVAGAHNKKYTRFIAGQTKMLL